MQRTVSSYEPTADYRVRNLTNLLHRGSCEPVHVMTHILAFEDPTEAMSCKQDGRLGCNQHLAGKVFADGDGDGDVNLNVRVERQKTFQKDDMCIHRAQPVSFNEGH